MADSGSRSVRVLVFDGTHKSFQLWWVRFQAYTRLMKCYETLFKESAGLLESEDASIDETTDVGALHMKMKKQNDMGMAHLTMAFSSEISMGLVYKSAMSTEWSGGQVHLVIDGLMKKYKPLDTITRVELRQKLNGVAMKKGQDPAVIFKQISSIENQYNAPGKHIEEDDLIAVVLDAASIEYQPVLTSEQRLRGDALTLANLESAMNQHWKQTKTTKKDEDNNEISLSTFEGACFMCQEKGHKANTCPKKTTNSGKAYNGNGNGNGNGKSGGKRFTGKCNNCGKTGHISANCWQKEETSLKSPKM